MSKGSFKEDLVKEMARLTQLVKDKPLGIEFKEFPVFIPLSKIITFKGVGRSSPVIDVTSVAKALKNIEAYGNRPQEFVKDAKWNMLLPNVATYLCSAIDALPEDLSLLENIYLLMDIPSNSDLIKRSVENKERQGRNPDYWVILAHVPAPVETPVEETVEEPTPEPLPTDQVDSPSEEQEVGNEDDNPELPEDLLEAEEELVDEVPAEQAEEPQKDA